MRNTKHTKRLSKEYDLIKTYQRLMQVIDRMNFNTEIALKFLDYKNN